MLSSLAKSSPLVSVIIPAYNCSDTVQKTLNSVLEQDYPAIEILVINDGSTDNTRTLLESYSHKIKIIDQENSGSAVSRSKGIQAASGKYIAFIDADDLWVSWKISTQVSYLENNPDVGMIYNAWVLISNDPDSAMLPKAKPDDNLLQKVDENLSGYLYTQLLMECVVHTSAVVMLKQVCLDVGDFDSTLRRGQDYDYWLRVSRLAKIVKLASVLSAYRIHEASITHQVPSINYEAQLLTKAVSLYGLTDQVGKQIPLKVMNKHFAKSWAGFCWSNYHAGNYKRTLLSAIKIIRHCPAWHVGWSYIARASGQMLVKTASNFLLLKNKNSR